MDVLVDLPVYVDVGVNHVGSVDMGIDVDAGVGADRL